MGGGLAAILDFRGRHPKVTYKTPKNEKFPLGGQEK